MNIVVKILLTLVAVAACSFLDQRFHAYNTAWLWLSAGTVFSIWKGDYGFILYGAVVGISYELYVRHGYALLWIPALILIIAVVITAGKMRTTEQVAPGPANGTSADLSDEQYYAQAAEEFESDSIQKGLFTKAEVEAGGDPDKARLLYIQWRVRQLIEESLTVHASPVPKAQHRDILNVDLENGVFMEFVPIEAGSFTMGASCDNGENRDERPTHEVVITEPFWLAKTPVTQAQYQQIMGINPAHFKGEENPEECVSWHDAIEFCEQLTALEWQAKRLPEGYKYTLPTEAQWEYACRIGDDTGDLDEKAWFMANSEVTTHPVGTKKANVWGLFDMLGNVWEWCFDVHNSNYYEKSPVCNPVNTGPGKYRVIRGGGWDGDAEVCLSTYRGKGKPRENDESLGFRVCLSG